MELENSTKTVTKDDFLKSILGNAEESAIANDKIEQYEKSQAEQKEIEKQDHYKKSGVGERYWNLRIEDFDAYSDELKNNLEQVKRFIADVNSGKCRTLWLCGENGTGKTMLASLIVRECWGKYAEIYCIDDDLKDSLRFNSEETRTKVFNRYKNYKVLVIDEVGRFPSDEEKRNLFHILNDRYANNKSTVIVSNLDKKTLCEYMGKALFDRFLENCTSLVFSDKSYRSKLREKIN